MQEVELKQFGDWLDEKSKRKTRARLRGSTKKQYMLQLSDENLPLHAGILQARIDANRSLLFNAALKNYLLFKQESGVLNRKAYLGLVKELDFKMMSSMHDSKLTFEELKQEVFTSLERDVLFGYSEKLPQMIMRILYDTAARKSEIIHPETGITVGEIKYLVDEKDRNYASIQIQGKGFIVKSRTVFLEPDTTQMVINHIQEYNLQPENKLITLIRKDGQPYKNQGSKLWQMLGKIGKASIGRKIKPHSFRHTKLTDMVNSGARLEDVQSYAGHSDISTTRIYAKMSEVQSKRGFDASRRLQ